MLFDPLYLAIVIGFGILGWVVQRRLKNKFKKYGNTPLREHVTGKEVAERMLSDHGISDVEVLSTPGSLSDHYNPQNKTINLSPDVYNGSNVAAAAVAAHETGHAVQHAESYAFLTLRSSLVPIVQVSSSMMHYVFMFGMAAAFFGFMNWGVLLIAAIIGQGAMAIFSLITLPVEFDASSRALKWIEGSYLANSVGQAEASDALKWAAMTYVVAALAAITQLLYFVMMFFGGRD